MRLAAWWRQLAPHFSPDAVLRLKPTGQAQLLRMSFDRLRYSTSTMPMMAVFVTAYLVFGVQGNPLWVLAWGAGYLLAAQQVKKWHARFMAELTQAAPDAVVLNWHRKLKRLALVHGVGISMVVPLTMLQASHEFMMIIYATLVAILSANSGQMTPFFSIFQRMFWGSIGMLLLMPWSLPDYWLYLMPMSFLMSAVMYRSAIHSHLFFVRQVELEELSQDLAIRYKQASELADEALQQKNGFLATASHDLRQPLHALNLNVETLSQSKLGPQHQLVLQDIQICARSLTLMFNSILDLSKLESGNTSIDLRPVDLTQLLGDLGRVFAAEAQQRQLDFRLRLPSHALVIQSDENLVRQIVTNLLQNALRYTTQGGVLLALRASPSPRIDVVDTGIGIAEADKPLIHQPFFRARVGFSKQIDSHGLGLAVVGRCVALLGAQHGFLSRPERGSRFWVSFAPQARVDASVPIATPAQAKPVQYAGSLVGDHCLIVEDDPILVRAWQRFLKPTGLELVIAADAEQTAGAFNAGFRPDYVLCDLRLRSGDNGYAILQSVLSQCPEASGAMVSGEFNAPELLEAAEEGIPVLQKPVSPEELMRLLMLWRSLRSN